MADSGTYDQATILRRQKIAEQMLAESSKPQPIRHWAQGLAHLGNVGADAFALNRLDKQANESRKSDTAALMAGLNLGGDTAAPSAPAAPMPAMPSAAPSPLPAAAAPDPTQPRGIRNNNPLNIEAGDFTKGQPGFSGSDGRFAKFATPEQGTDAASKLLDVYSNKHGLNTVAGIVNRWAPATDGNPSQAYAASVAGRMGVAPDAPLNMADPTVKQKIIAAMGQFENGKPIPGNMVAGPGAPSGMPPVAPQAGAGAPPPAGPPAAPPMASGGPPAPSAPQAPGAIPAPSGVAPSQKEAIARLLSSTPGSPAYQLGIQLAGQAVKPHDFTYQTLPDGTVLRMDPTGRTQPTPVYQAPVKRELKDAGTDPITGQKTFQEYDPAAHTLAPVGGPGGAATSPQSGMLAPGVKSLDHSLKGEDYLNQFGPEVQSAVKSYMNGDVMPTGNPRKDSIANMAKTIAQKYGQDTGSPVSDATYSQRRTYRTQLGSNAPNSAGGQAKAFNQGIEHMGHLADALEKLDNSNGLGIPMVASAVNAMRQGLSTDQSAIADKASSIGQTLAGEVGKLFSGSAGGGVHERELTRERFSTVKSKPQLAAALEGTLEMMQGGMTALEQRRDEVMGPNSGIRFVNPETEKKIEAIRGTIDRLKGGAKAAAPPEMSGAAAVKEGTTATNPQTKEKVIFQGGKWVPLS